MTTTKFNDGSAYIDPRDITAFIFSYAVQDKRAHQLLVYLRNGHTLSFLGNRAETLHKQLIHRYPYNESLLPSPDATVTNTRRSKKD